MARKGFGLLLAVALATTALTGCVLPGTNDDDAPEPTSITRSVVIDLSGEEDAAMMGPEAFLSAIDASYEYTHEGPAVAPSEVEVAYDDANGEEATSTLDAWTSKATLQPGDRVTIDEVFPIGTITLTHEGEKIASRDGLDVPWLEVEGVPLPLSLQPGGLASYQVDMASGWEFSLSNLDVGSIDPDDDIDQGFIEEVSQAFNIPVTNTMRIAVAPTGQKVDLDLGSDGTPTGEGTLLAEMDNESIDAGFEGNADWALEFQAAFFLNAAQQLDKVGASGSIFVDGDVTAWFPGHPREEGWTPPELDHHPWFDEEFPYTEEEFDQETDVDTDTDIPPNPVVELLLKLWNTDIAVGDSFRLTTSLPSESGDDAKLEVVTQVLGREDKAVPGGPTLDSYRVHQQVDVTAPDVGESCRGDQSFQNDFWISAESYLPVFSDSNERYVIGPDEIIACLDFIEELGLPADEQEDLDRVKDALRDADFQLVLEGSATGKLVEHQRGITIPPMLFLASGASSALMGAAALQGFSEGLNEVPEPYEPYGDYEDDF